jgi:protein gp37
MHGTSVMLPGRGRDDAVLAVEQHQVGEPKLADAADQRLDRAQHDLVGHLHAAPGARPMQTHWAIDIRNQCLDAKVAFFFKQWGGRSPKSGS